jgi:hypothetical protein
MGATRRRLSSFAYHPPEGAIFWMVMRSETAMKERWNEIARLLREARDCLSPQHSGPGDSAVPIGLLTGTLDEFEEFLAHNELELAWDALLAVAERNGAPTLCWHKLAQAAGLMQLPGKEAIAAQRASPPITCDQALTIARQDAERAYRNLSPYEVTAVLAADGWHVAYELKNRRAHGGGPHYLIDPTSGMILWKKYEQ